jgi:Putative beta barrel porin-7 (BBP7)
MPRQLVVAVSLLFLTLSPAAAQTDDGAPRVAELYDYFAPAAGSQEVQTSLVDLQTGVVQAPLDAPPPASSDALCCFDACRFPCCYVQADGLFWHRVGVGCSQTAVFDTNTGSPLLATNDPNFDLAGGLRVLVGWQPHHCSNCCAWELSYFGIFDWNADAVVTGDGHLAIPGDLGLASNNFFGADEIALRYRSELHNVELNCIKSCCPDCTRLDFIAGFRYIRLNDSLSIVATDLQEGTSSYDINAHNDLYGVQLGGRLTRPLCCRWGLQLTGKAGIFYNDARQNQFATDFPDTPSPFVLRDSSGSGAAVAMLGEIGVVFIRPINDCWSLRIGYNALGIGGLALAADQLDFTDTLTSGTAIHNTGWIFAHGGLIGAQASW